MKISEFIAYYLDKIGVRNVFGVSGANIEDTFDAVVASHLILKMILAKHEFCAACMADGYSRTSHDLGIVMATSGGGSVNIVPGLAESMVSQRPVLAILGMPPTQLEGVGAFQDESGLNYTLDGEKLFSTLASKYFHRFSSSENFQEHLENAVEQALASPRGTSVLMIPKNIQLENIAVDLNEPIKKYFSSNHEAVAINPAVIHQLNQSKNKVLIVLGENCDAMGVKNLVESLVERLNAYVAVTAEGKSTYDHSNPRFVGVTGVAGHSSVLDVANQADTIIIIGSRLQLMSRAGLEKILEAKNIVYINDLPISYHLPSSQKNHIVLGDIKNSVQTILTELPVEPVTEAVQGRVVYQHPHYLKHVKANPFNFENIYFLFNRYINDQDIIYVDAGNAGGAGIHYLKGAAYFGVALGMGGMGYAIGASIGSCFESRQKTWCFLGDGALLMHGMEIHTAIEHQLPICFVIINNNSHAMCYDRDLLYLSGQSEFNLFKHSHYGSGFSAMFPGLYSYDVSNLEDLKSHLERLENYHKPSLLSLTMDYHEVPPFLPFLQCLKENEK